MVIKKINKKAQGFSLTSLVVVMLMAIGMFAGMFLFFQQTMLDNGSEVPQRYNETYTQLVESQESLDSNTRDLQAAVNDVREADDIFQVAWNGLKGLGSALKLPISFISNAVQITDSMIGALDFIPPFFKGLFITGVIAGVVFLIYSILKGEPRM